MPIQNRMVFVISEETQTGKFGSVINVCLITLFFDQNVVSNPILSIQKRTFKKFSTSTFFHAFIACFVAETK